MQSRSRIPASARTMDVYRVALDLVALLSPLAARIGRYNEDLQRQLQRALPVIPQCTAEGMRRLGNDRTHLLLIALGSVDEVRSIIDITAQAAVLTASEAETAEALADRVAAMLYRLHARC